MRDVDRLLIGGAWAAPHGSATVDVVEAHSEERLARMPDADAQDVDAAVRAARTAFDDGGWSTSPLAERIAAVERIAAGLETRSEELARTITSEVGCTLGFSKLAQVASPIETMRAFVDLASEYPWEERKAGRYLPFLLRREPVGVVGAVVAWNVPQVLIATKLAPALLAGCTIVVKAAPEASLDATIFAEVVAGAGLPPGVVSVLTGGVETGRALVAHPGVDKVAFTGSAAAGREIAATCGQQLKRVGLELGGKSATIVLPDADLDVVAAGLRFTSFMNNGQACAAQTRVLAPRSRYAEVVDAVAGAADALVVGDPFVKGHHIGPVASARQRDRVRGYIELGIAEGARLVTGGPEAPPGLDQGWFVQPTVFADVDNAMRVAREEIFGPVLVVIPYDDGGADGADDAVRIANDSEYGLAGSVWTTDPEQGLAVARRVRTGTFGINGYAPDPTMPFGGYKDSGIGREWGDAGLDEYTELKAISGI
ncbi:MAG: aldehyde dehydrogenase [Acidimicrobiales bacterium]